MAFLSKYRISSAFLCVAGLVISGSAKAAQWLPYGPYGGDARSFAVDPANHAHLFLGTVTGWVYESSNSGATWKRLAQMGKRDDLVIDNLLVDAANPKHLTIGAWSLGGKTDGGIFQSTDGGVTWAASTEMQGQSVLAIATAPSDPKIVVAGTLAGVYRSSDSGAHWERISPPENKEIHEVESIAIDPLDPKTIYAGTWHLPWKTKDGGKTWENIKEGVIDDSDVFSIIVDPKNPKVVFASACSGIYKSQSGGEKSDKDNGLKGNRFQKVQGIPTTARRTRVLMQDPTHEEIVFAGTTEGLWRSNDLGKTWSRTTGPEVIVNDVFIDPTDSKKVLLATDRGGVLSSEDGGNTFTPSNTGFSTRQISAFTGDAKRSGTLYAGVVNDRQWGGVFTSTDGGLNWAQQSVGLGGNDVFSLAEAPDGTLVAGTGHGIYRYEQSAWVRVPGEMPTPKPVPKMPMKGVVGKKEFSATRRKATADLVVQTPQPRGDDGIVYSLAALGNTMFAGTSVGMLRSGDSGKTWEPVASAGDVQWRMLTAAHGSVAAAGVGEIKLSTDGGQSWADVKAPESVKQVRSIALDDRGELWVGGREGVYLSTDAGRSWQTLNNLYVRDVDGLYFDQNAGKLYVGSSDTAATYAYAVDVKSRKVSFWQTGWNLRFVRPVGDHLLGATLFDGIVIEPRMVDTKEMAAQ